MHAAQRSAVCEVAAESRWRAVPRTERSEVGVFLQACCDAGVFFSLQIYRVSKNHNTMSECPAPTGPGRTACHTTVLFSQNTVALRKDNCIYRPVSCRFFLHHKFLNPLAYYSTLLKEGLYLPVNDPNIVFEEEVRPQFCLDEQCK